MGSDPVDYTRTPGYDQIMNEILQRGAGAGWTSGKTSSVLGQYGSDFQQQFYNAVGRYPTQDEVNQYFTQAVEPVINSQAGFSGTDPAAITQQYIPQAFGSQIQQSQQKKAQDQINQLTQQENQALQGNINTIQNAIPGIASNVTNTFMNGPGYQSVLGQLNNAGIVNSGATANAVGSTLANDINSNISPLISGLIGQGTGQIQNNPQQAFNLGQGNYNAYQNLGLGAQQGIAGYNQQLNNFNMESQLAQMLAEMSQPSTAQKDIGMAAGSSQALANLGQAYGGSKGTSYVCMELIKRGLLCEQDMDDFHVHIMPAMFKKGRAFWKYAVDGKRLVDSVNARGLDWSSFKPLLFDRVMREPDSCKAVDLYADACHQLCLGDPSLWDGRVFRTSLADSIPFLPRLFFYTPFLKALWKCVRIKTLMIYDRPECSHGS